MAPASAAQKRLDKAIIAHEQAEAEVERLCDILQRATEALVHARETKAAAQKELDEAALAAKKATAAEAAPPRRRNLFGGGRQQRPAVVEDAPAQRMNSSGSRGSNGKKHSVGFSQEDALPAESYEEESDDESSEESEEVVEEKEEDDDDEEEEESDDESEEGFDMGEEALQQIRYRLEAAKIDPNSPNGTKLLDELLIRLQDSHEDVIDTDLVNKYMDDLLFADQETKPPPPPPPQNPKHAISKHAPIRVNRGGKVLGWYQGQLDERGYIREGKGSMYYDAGHECHGTWHNDEMIGRGIYQWSDGHVYDGEWHNGKRHGLGRFVRPDNVVLYGRYEKGHHKGEGVRWSADRREAQVVVDGVPKKTVSLSRAKDIATNLGFSDALPPPV